MTTVGEALAAFESSWVETQPITPQTAYRRTLRLVGLYLRDHPPGIDAPLADLTPDALSGFVVWHRAHALADDARGTYKVAVHVARLGAFLAEQYGMADLALDRDALRALVPDEEPA